MKTTKNKRYLRDVRAVITNKDNFLENTSQGSEKYFHNKYSPGGIPHY